MFKSAPLSNAWLHRDRHGFTLMELAIVLTIIGLLIGGVVAGQSLIEGATVQSQIKQIDQYRVAANGFKQKYLYWPGDLPNAADFGLHPRQDPLTCKGYGDGNGVVQGVNNVNSCAASNEGGNYVFAGESLLFWQDLQQKGFIADPIVALNSVSWNGDTQALKAPDCFPQAKIGRSHYIYIASGGGIGIPGSVGDGQHYLGLAAINTCTWASIKVSTNMLVDTAYGIDAKIDDGLPQSGSVTAMISNAMTYPRWAAGINSGGTQLYGATAQCCFTTSMGDFNAPTTAATAYADTNCYDNNNVAGPQQYSMRNGSKGNCALHFKM